MTCSKESPFTPLLTESSLKLLPRRNDRTPQRDNWMKSPLPCRTRRGSGKPQRAPVRNFQPTAIPGLLQTPEYAHRMIPLAGIAGVIDHAAVAAARLERQQALFAADAGSSSSSVRRTALEPSAVKRSAHSPA